MQGLKSRKRELFIFIYLFLFFNFTILYWFCHISTWICHRHTHVPHPESSSLPVPSLWVVPVHQPQVSSIMHRSWTGDSFHIWYCTCFNAVLPNHPTLSLSHRVQKTVLYISVWKRELKGELLPIETSFIPAGLHWGLRSWRVAVETLLVQEDL